MENESDRDDKARRDKAGRITDAKRFWTWCLSFLLMTGGRPTNSVVTRRVWRSGGAGEFRIWR